MSQNTREIQEAKIIKLQEKGFMSRAMKGLVKILAKPVIKRAIRKVDKDIKNDPEVQAALHDYWDTRDRLRDKISGFCAHHPDSSICQKRKR